MRSQRVPFPQPDPYLRRQTLILTAALPLFACSSDTPLLVCDGGTALNDAMTECSSCLPGLTRIDTDGGFRCSDAGLCEGRCSAAERCRPADLQCVQCLDASHCSAPNSLCNPAGQCVQCLANADCTSPDNAQCSPTGQCIPCSSNAHCTSQSNRNVCDSGQCVECASASDCGGNPCNPVTQRCSAFGTDVRTCERCDTDENCSVPNQRCINLMFAGAPRGGYCLLENPGTCPQPFSVGITKPSLSGAASTTYCGINEALTTCEAVLLRGMQCANCVGVPGARCETILATSNPACTYSCSEASECNSTGNLASCDTAAGGFCGS